MNLSNKFRTKPVFGPSFIVFLFVLAGMTEFARTFLKPWTSELTDIHSPWLLMTPLILPAVMLPGGNTWFKSKISLIALGIVAVASGILLMGNASGWFGQVSSEPYMWHKGRHVKVQDKEVFVVFLNIQNRGRGSMKLRLDPVTSPSETFLIMTSQQYDETKKQWVDYPIGRLLSERSKSMFPFEIRSNGSLILEMIFTPADRDAEAVSPAFENLPGRYSIAISDPVKFRTYRHEINVPAFSPGTS